MPLERTRGCPLCTDGLARPHHGYRKQKRSPKQKKETCLPSSFNEQRLLLRRCPTLHQPNPVFAIGPVHFFRERRERYRGGEDSDLGREQERKDKLPYLVQPILANPVIAHPSGEPS
ncbi:unnamed protein product, partial [Ectocarpus fasciculatus]